MKACTGVVVDTGRLRMTVGYAMLLYPSPIADWLLDTTATSPLPHHVIYLFDKVSPRLLPLLVCTAWLVRVFFDP